MKHVLKLLAIIVPVYFIGYFLESSRQVSSVVGDYFEISTELLPLVLSFSIFVVTWFAYRRSRDNHSLFLGFVFFLIGLLELYHMLSHPFMPNFITPNSTRKSTIFWSEGLLASASLFLASSYIYKDTFPKLINKSALFASIIIISSVSLTIGLFYSDNLPLIYYLNGNPSIVLISLELITTALILYAVHIYMARFKETRQNNIIYIIYSFIIIISSNIVSMSYDYAGSLLRAASFYFAYLALYKSSVELPYEKASEVEAKLRLAADERYRNLVDNADDAILTTDVDFKVTSWNRSAERIFGWTVQEVIGNKLTQLIIPSNMQVENEQIIHNALLGKIVSGIETVCLCKDGTLINVSLTVSALRDADKNIVGLSFIIRNITDRIRAEEMRINNERLVYAIKAKSEFLTALSHDLGTPLNAIIGFSELLKKRITGELNKNQEHYVDNVLISAYRMLDIINDVLDLGNAETGKIYLSKDKISLPDTIDETILLIKEKAAKNNITLKKEFDPELEFIEADRQRFKQILFNLLSNALKFSKPTGGTVTITTLKEGDMARISISDMGIGIRDEDMGRLFKTFEQLNLGISSRYGSTGLGLVVTKKLVELHGGKIIAESKYGEGSTFTFLLPLMIKKVEIK